MRNLWWIGLSVLAGLALGVALRQAEGPSSVVASDTPPCATDGAVAAPADNPDLVSDCSLLLAVKDTLRGTATTLNWDADTAIADWYGDHRERYTASRDETAPRWTQQQDLQR